jgi:dTDP-4-amino-4,6-dideoxygalactose transaminase
VQKPGRCSAHHLYVVQVQGGKQKRDKFYDALYKGGIGVNIHYIPVYKQPYYCMSNIKLSASETYYNNSLSLPLFPNLSNENIELVVKNVIDAYGRQ